MKIYDLGRVKFETQNFITNELERYKLILDYFDKYPQRIKPNEDYLIELSDRLIELSVYNQKISSDIKKLSSKLLEDFLSKNENYYE